MLLCCLNSCLLMNVWSCIASFFFFTIKENNVITNKNWQVLVWSFFFSWKKKKGSCPLSLTHAQWGRLTHTLMVLSFFTFCAGYATTPISCDGSTVPHTGPSIRLLSTSDSLLCLSSGILTPACVTLPCAFPSVILLQARCNFISHNGTFLNTPEGERRSCHGPPTKGRRSCCNRCWSAGASLFLNAQKTALPRCCATVLPVVHHRFGAMHTLHLIYLFIYLYLPFFFCLCTSVYILAVHFVPFIFYVTARIYCCLLACVMTMKWNF